MQRIHLDGGQSLLDVFNADVCGCDARQGKPHPEILLLAATELGVAPAHCLVVEDAPVGIEAARAGRMTALGGARLGNTALLRAAGTDLVVTSLDKAPIDETGGWTTPIIRRGTMEHVLTATADPAWVIDENGYDPLRESSRESRFAISNGFLGVRGARAINRGARWVVPPRTYVAGLFDAPGPEQPISGLVTAPDWLEVRILLFGTPLIHHPGDGSSHRRTLDMRRGALLTECHLSN